MIGRPGRIGALERILAATGSRQGVWIARRDEIARHWLEVATEGGMTRVRLRLLLVNPNT